MYIVIATLLLIAGFFAFVEMRKRSRWYRTAIFKVDIQDRVKIYCFCAPDEFADLIADSFRSLIVLRQGNTIFASGMMLDLGSLVGWLDSRAWNGETVKRLMSCFLEPEIEEQEQLCALSMKSQKASPAVDEMAKMLRDIVYYDDIQVENDGRMIACFGKKEDLVRLRDFLQMAVE